MQESVAEVKPAAVSWAFPAVKMAGRRPVRGRFDPYCGVTAASWRMFVLQRPRMPLQQRIGGCSCCNGLSDRYSDGLADARVAAVSQIVTTADWRMLVLQRSRMPLQRRVGGCSCCNGLSDRYSDGLADARVAAVPQIVIAAKQRILVLQRCLRSLQRRNGGCSCCSGLSDRYNTKRRCPRHPLMLAFSLIEPNIHGDDQSDQRKDGQPQVEKALPLILLEESQDS